MHNTKLNDKLLRYSHLAGRKMKLLSSGENARCSHWIHSHCFRRASALLGEQVRVAGVSLAPASRYVVLLRCRASGTWRRTSRSVCKSHQKRIQTFSKYKKIVHRLTENCPGDNQELCLDRKRGRTRACSLIDCRNHARLSVASGDATAMRSCMKR